MRNKIVDQTQRLCLIDSGSSRCLLNPFVNRCLLPLLLSTDALTHGKLRGQSTFDTNVGAEDGEVLAAEPNSYRHVSVEAGFRTEMHEYFRIS